MRRVKLILLFCSFLMGQKASAQLFTFTFTGTGTCPTQGNSVPNPTNATVSAFSRVGLSCTSTANAFNSSGWTISSTMDNTQYLEVIITASAGYQLNLSSASFTVSRSTTGPVNMEIAHNGTGSFTTNTTATVTATDAPVSFDFTDFSTGPGGTVSFRIYGWGGTSTTGTMRISNFSVNGSISPNSPFTFDYINGRVGIGVTPTETLSVNGNIRTKRLIVNQTGWPDYVFDSSYQPQPLTQLAQYIQNNKHLPGVHSAKEITDSGLDVGNNQAALLQKIEELTLYVIAQDKKQQQQDKKEEQQDRLIDIQSKLIYQQQQLLLKMQTQLNKLQPSKK